MARRDALSQLGGTWEASLANFPWHRHQTDVALNPSEGEEESGDESDDCDVSPTFDNEGTGKSGEGGDVGVSRDGEAKSIKGEARVSESYEAVGLPFLAALAREAPSWWLSNGPDLLLKMSCLGAFHCAAPRQAARFGLLSVLIPSTAAGIAQLRGGKGIPKLPVPLRFLGLVGKGLSACSLPVCVFFGVRLLCKFWPRAGHRHDAAQGCDPVLRRARDLSSLDAGLPHPRDLQAALQEASPQNAIDFAHVCEPFLKNLHLMLDWERIRQCPRFAYRFDDTQAELMRYAWTTGLTTAETQGAVEEALVCAAERIKATMLWTHSYSFYSLKELRTDWGRLMKFTKRTTAGHPVLCIKLGQGLQECSGADARLLGAAIVSQVDRGVRKLLDNKGADQIVAVVDCSGTGLFQVFRLLSLIKDVVATLAQHYPGRLREVHLVHVPTLLCWVANAAKDCLHPATFRKLHVHGSDLSSLPHELQDVMGPLQGGPSQGMEESHRDPQMSTSLSRIPGSGSGARVARGLPEFPVEAEKDGRTGSDDMSTIVGLCWALLLCMFTFMLLQYVSGPDSLAVNPLPVEDDL